MIPHAPRAGTLPVSASKSTTKADNAGLVRALLLRPGLPLVFLLAALAAVPAGAQMTLLPSSSIVAGNGTAGYSGDSGAATSAEMNIPAGVGIDSAGNIYITEFLGCRIRKITIATGIISTVAGTGTCGNGADGGQATSTQINEPNHRVAFDSSGNFYFAESGNHKIRKVNISTGVITTVAGNGTAGSTGDGAAATSAELNAPGDVYIDSSNNLYIADSHNNKIRKVTNSTGYISTVAGNGTAGSTGDGAAATSGELNDPQTVTLDSAGNIYIGDYSNNKIRKVTISTGYISTVAGNGTTGFSGDGGAATSAELNGAYGIVFDSSDNFYIADPLNVRVRMVNIATGIITTVVGNGTAGYTSTLGPAISAEMNYPNGMAMDSSGNLYITESANSVIRKVFLNPSLPTTALGSSSAAQNFYFQTTSAETLTSFTAQQSQGSKQEFSVGTITGCTVNGSTSNASGTICTVPITFTPAYPGLRSAPLAAVTGSGNIDFGLTGTGTGPLAALIPGTISTVAGNGTAGETGNGAAATSGEVNGPNRVAVDSAGNYYIADVVGNTVRKVTASTGYISVVAGNGTAGYTGDGGAATSAELHSPNGLGVDSAGNIYIADDNNCRIRKVTVATGIISTVAGNGTCGYSGDGGAATSAEINLASSDIVFDSLGNFYFGDPANNRVRKVNISTGIISTVAGNGTAGSTGDGGAATSADLNSPISVALDGSGNLYMTDNGEAKVRKVTVATGIITTVAGNGTAGYSGDGGAATSAELNSNVGVTVDVAGNIYIADQSNNRIRFVDAATGIITTIAGNGTAGFAGDSGSATAAELNGPPDVALDSAGNLIIADSSNNRVRKVTVNASPMTFATSTAVGEADSTDDPLSATMINIGNASMTVNVPSSGTNPSVSSYFTLDNSTTCPDLNTSSSAGTLASGAECTLAVDFYPTVAGSVTGSVVVTDNSLGGSATTQTINTTATAIAVGTTTTLTTSLTPSAYSESVTFTATVAPVGGSAVPTGTVQFSIDGSNVGSAVSLSGGAATYATSTLTSGTHTIGAVFAGNSSFNTSTASTISQTVNADDTTSSAPTTNVGTTSATQTVTVDIDTSGTLNSISVVTGGTTGLDYAYVSGGTCATGTAYTAGQTCTVKYSFTPAHPGQRLGAVLLYTSTPTLMGTAYLSGQGTGPMGLFTTPTATTVSTSISEPRGISFDGAGNLYVSDYAGSTVYKITPGGTQSTVATITEPRGTVVDGAGNLFVGSWSGAVVYEIPAGSTTATSIASIPGGVDVQLVVDSAGNVYAESTTSNNVYQIAAGTHAVTQILTGGQSVTGGTLGRCPGMAIDASNNLYLADYTNNRIYKVTNGTWAVTTLVNNDGNLDSPSSLAVDPAGNIYVANFGNSKLIRYSAGTYTANVFSTSEYTAYAAVAIDPSGNLYTGLDSATAVYKYNRNATPTLSYSSTAVGLTSADQIEGFENDGNASLTFTTFAGTNASFNGTDTTCSISTALTSGSTCNFGIAFAPTAYGNPLTGNANITDNNLNVGGTVQQVPVSGTATADSTSTSLASSLNASTYGSSVTFTATVSDTIDGALTPTGTVQFSIDGSNVGSAVTLSSGTATYSTSTLTGGSHSIGAVYTPSSTSYSSSTASTFTQTVNKATPTVSAWPTASAITYGQTLASSTLSGGTASVGGTFAWTTSSTAPGAGTPSESVTFTPTDTTDYNTVNGSVNVTVNKATPTVSAWPTASAITYGQTLASSTLSGGTASVGGSFAWTTSSTAPGAGTPSESVTFTPTDTTDYNTPSAGSVTVTVNKATPTVSAWPTASAITYGQTLASSTLSGGTASVGGSFAWTTSSTAPGAGTPSESVKFTPTDTTDYNTVSGSVNVTVNKATPTVSAWPTASAITYGQTLASSTLSGGTASVGGTFAWTTSSTAPGAGTPSESVTFTPTDTTDYNTVSGSVNVTVNKATPTVSAWPTASAITYGQTLASSTLSGGTASVGGTFAWTTSSTAPGAGTPSESVTFTPTDTTDYNTPSAGSVTVTVNKATPTVSAWPTASAITYGQTLASSTLSGGTASVGGTFAWTTSSTAPGAGTPSESVTFTPTDTTDYNTVSGSVNVTVNKATPTVSAWPTASSITFGQTLASSTLTGGTASVGGTFAWTTSSTAPAAGTPSESVTFTPTDTTDYNTVTNSVFVTVNKATPTVSAWPTASAITYGQTLASSTLSGGTASVGGSFAWTTSSTAPGAGTPSESVTFTPSDTSDYNTVVGSVTVTVNKATPTVSVWPTASAITYGQTLASSTLSGGTASVGGTFAWTSSSTAPGAGTPSESVTFTPTDTTDYNATTGSVTVTVGKATPTVSVWPSASTLAYGETLASSTLTGGSASVSGTYAWTTPATVPGAGTPSESVTFTPTDTTDYNTVSASVPVTVNTATTSSTAPTTNVGSTSATQTVTLNVTTAGTLSTISVLTEGTADLDFAYVSGGTCATGTAYTAGQTCTVKYSFAPAFPGQRLGAVLLYTSTPTLIGTSYLSGQGVAPMGLFTTPTATTVSTSVSAPRGISFDGAGNLYVSDYAGGTVYKVTPGGTQSTVATITEPRGTVVDGAGNLFVGSLWDEVVYEIPAGSSTATSIASIPGGVDAQLVVDSVGNVYAESTTSYNVYQIAAGTHVVTQILTGGQSVTGGTLGRCGGMAIDASNNLYLADYTNNRIYKVTNGTWAVSTLVNNDGNLNSPSTLAVDPAGNIYVANFGNSTVVRYSAGTYAAKVFSTSNYTGDGAIAIDPSGNLYTGLSSATAVYKYNRNATPTLTYSSTAVGVASADQIEGFENDGNAALTFSTFAGTNASFNGTDTTCSTSFVLASGSTCNFGVSFQPSTTGSPLTGDANITDNTLNASGTVQQIPVSGTAGADNTSTVISSSDNPSAFNQSVTFTATVTDTNDGSLTPTGTVQFSIDGSNVGSAVTLSGGTATYSTSTLTVGSHNIGAVYTSSSGNYSNSTATTYVQSLNTKATPTITSWPTASAITYGQTLASSTLSGGSASVSGTFAWTTPSTAPGAGTPMESVTFTPTDTTDYNTPNAASVTVTVNKATPTVSVWPTASPITYGQTLAYSDLTGGTASVSGTFTWTAPSTGPLAGTPSESVTFTPSDTTDYNVPATGSVTVTVNKSSVTVNGITSLNVSYYGDNVTLTYTFTGPGITPTGTTTIKDGATTLGTVSLSSGVATYSTSTLAAGAHTLTAVYNGDSNYQ